jgi:hypothetical protein
VEHHIHHSKDFARNPKTNIVLLYTHSCKLAMLSNVLLKQASRRSAATAVVAGSRRGFAKEIKFGVEGRAAMLRGVDVLADAVQVRNTRGCVGEGVGEVAVHRICIAQRLLAFRGNRKLDLVLSTVVYPIGSSTTTQ